LINTLIYNTVWWTFAISSDWNVQPLLNISSKQIERINGTKGKITFIYTKLRKVWRYQRWSCLCSIV